MKYDNLCVSCLRALSLDGTNNAKSGHPGMALSSAPIVYTLYTRHLNSDPTHPEWVNRDRFILSAGHASILLYSLLHLSGFNVSKDDLKNFRKLNSKTPGHPEVGHTSGVDNTSGPLGQGIGQAVGVALAESILRNSYPEGDKLFNHYTYCLCGDGCLEEGVSQEAISFAGENHLNKLILFYDYNKVTLDGPLSDSSSEDVSLRFKAEGWNVIRVIDGNDCELIDQAIIQAKQSLDKPSVIIVDTIIGYGTPLQGTCKCHGSPVGLENAEKAKEFYKYNYGPFEVPDEVYMVFKSSIYSRGIQAYNLYVKTYKAYKEKYPEQAKQIEGLINNDVSSFLIKDIDSIQFDKDEATRIAFGHALNLFASKLPNLVGGSADVASSTKTKMQDVPTYTYKTPNGRNINFGIREFGMACIQNGLLLHKGLRSYVSTFLVFSDYLKPAIKLAALSKLPAVYIFTHDSIALGEDGPTHQPIEHLAMLRSIPNVNVIRPADSKETFAALKLAFESTSTPTVLILTRQNVRQVPNTNYLGVKNGGYIVSKEIKKLDFTLIASGSEVNLALDAQKILLEKGIDTRVVSMPSLNSFNELEENKKEEVLGGDYSHRIFVEMLSTYGLYRYSKYVMGLDEFGRSAPGKDVTNFFKFTPEELARRVVEAIEKENK